MATPEWMRLQRNLEIGEPAVTKTYEATTPQKRPAEPSQTQILITMQEEPESCLACGLSHDIEACQMMSIGTVLFEKKEGELDDLTRRTFSKANRPRNRKSHQVGGGLAEPRHPDAKGTESVVESTTKGFYARRRDGAIESFQQSWNKRDCSYGPDGEPLQDTE